MHNIILHVAMRSQFREQLKSELKRESYELSMKKDGRYHSFKIQGLFHNFQDLVDMLLVRVGTAGWF
jgi:hypothetical protein